MACLSSGSQFTLVPAQHMPPTKARGARTLGPASCGSASPSCPPTTRRKELILNRTVDSRATTKTCSQKEGFSTSEDMRQRAGLRKAFISLQSCSRRTTLGLHQSPSCLILQSLHLVSRHTGFFIPRRVTLWTLGVIRAPEGCCEKLWMETLTLCVFC